MRVFDSVLVRFIGERSQKRILTPAGFQELCGYFVAICGPRDALPKFSDATSWEHRLSVDIDRSWRVGATLTVIAAPDLHREYGYVTGVRRESEEPWQYLRMPARMEVQTLLGTTSPTRSLADAVALIKLQQELIDLGAQIVSALGYYESCCSLELASVEADEYHKALAKYEAERGDL